MNRKIHIWVDLVRNTISNVECNTFWVKKANVARWTQRGTGFFCVWCCEDYLRLERRVWMYLTFNGCLIIEKKLGHNFKRVTDLQSEPEHVCICKHTMVRTKAEKRGHTQLQVLLMIHFIFSLFLRMENEKNRGIKTDHSSANCLCWITLEYLYRICTNKVHAEDWFSGWHCLFLPL